MLIVLFSCSTKKNSLTRRIYHNLTSHITVTGMVMKAIKKEKPS